MRTRRIGSASTDDRSSGRLELEPEQMEANNAGWLDNKEHDADNLPIVTPPRDIVRYAAWAIAIVSTLIWIHTRDSAV